MGSELLYAVITFEHSSSILRGEVAADVSLVELATGQELAMPTEFDYFGEAAWHGWTVGLSPEQIQNRDLLKAAMEQVGGFSSYSKEWWHYTWGPSTSYPLLDFQMK